MVTTRAPAPAVPRPMRALIAFLPGRFRGADFMMPCSLPKATMEPVSVTPPMAVPAKAATLCSRSGLGSPMYDATLAAIAAPPTSEWNAATSCGRSVMAMRAAMPAPVRPPAPNSAAACM